MVALGANNLSVSSAPSGAAGSADSDASTATPVPPPTRVVPVGGLIKNGNFASGGLYWEGDGRANPSGKGLAVTLNPSSWTRVYQSFMGDQGAQYSIEVTYSLSPGLTLSPNPADYTGISDRLQIDGFENYKSIAMPPGSFYGTVGDPDGSIIAMEYYTPRQGTTEIQDYHHTYPPIPNFQNKTFVLAFPPGTGKVTLLTVYVKSN